MIFKFKDLSAFDPLQTATHKKDVNFEEIFPHAIDTCKIKERASDLEVENIVNNFLPTTMTEKCFVACWLETFGVLVNRRFDRDQYIKLSTYGQNTDENSKNVLKKILQSCKLHNTCKQNRWAGTDIHSQRNLLEFSFIFQVRTSLSHNEVHQWWSDSTKYRPKDIIKNTFEIEKWISKNRKNFLQENAHEFFIINKNLLFH